MLAKAVVVLLVLFTEEGFGTNLRFKRHAGSHEVTFSGNRWQNQQQQILGAESLPTEEYHQNNLQSAPQSEPSRNQYASAYKQSNGFIQQSESNSKFRNPAAKINKEKFNGYNQESFPGKSKPLRYPTGQSQQQYSRGQLQQKYSGRQPQQQYSIGQSPQQYAGGQLQQKYSGRQPQQQYSGGQPQEQYAGGQPQQQYSGRQPQQQYSGGQPQQQYPGGQPLKQKNQSWDPANRPSKQNLNESKFQYQNDRPQGLNSPHMLDQIIKNSLATNLQLRAKDQPQQTHHHHHHHQNQANKKNLKFPQIR